MWIAQTELRHRTRDLHQLIQVVMRREGMMREGTPANRDTEKEQESER